MQLSKNFTLTEATKSDIARRHGIDNIPDCSRLESLKITAQNILQPVRDHYQKPFSPTSFFRCLELNTLLKSKPTSQHVKGEAVDFEVPGVTNFGLAKWIENTLNFDQLILEYYIVRQPASGWVHCSYVDADKNRNETLTFNGMQYRNGLPDLHD